MKEEEWPVDEILFVDTGLEFPQMYEHLDKLERYLQFPITRLKPPHTFEYLLYEYMPPRKNPALAGLSGLSWPGPQCRWCTARLKTRVIDRRQRVAAAKTGAVTQEDLAALIEPSEDETEDDQLVREKYVDLLPMTEEEALVQTDLIGHDFYVFTNATTGLINVIYHRKNGGYGIIKPKIEEENE